MSSSECVARVLDGSLSDDCNCPDCRDYWEEMARHDEEDGRGGSDWV